MKNDSINITIGGEAGQGIVTIGYLLCQSLVRSGYRFVVSQSYFSQIRGGHNTFTIQVSDERVSAACESIDLLVALDETTLTEDRKNLSSGGLVLVDEEKVETGDEDCLPIPFAQLSPARYSNTVAMGVIGYLLGLERGIFEGLLDQKFGKKKSETLESNLSALRNTYEWCSQQPSLPLGKLHPISNPVPRLLMNGNEAIALGAMSAGLKFCSFYPMTPSTSIVANLIANATKMGLVIEQAEDEIAAINMAIGASFAGATSMVTTSGGGFALMVEAVSLAGVAETPLVVALAQRPGPATGLPTRTEQGDLEMVLHSGHGDFPRPVLTPGSVEECFHLTRKAFELAEKYQGPVFLMTDQYLADLYCSVDPFDLENFSPIRSGNDEPGSLPYMRYAFTESGISPRLLPGRSEHLSVGDSHEHTEDGHITEDPVIRKRMVDKRLQKEKSMLEDIVPPEMDGDDKPELLFVSWGSTKGAVYEAAGRLRLQGKRTATLHFPQVWPMVPDHFLKHFENADRVVCVEGNATGQLARLIRRETGFLIEQKLLRYDGRSFTPEWILNELNL